MKRNKKYRYFRNYKTMVIGRENRYVCHYCGYPAETLDHIPPLSRYDDALAITDKFNPVLVPSCGECNGLAGTELHISFLERQEFVKGKLRKKYKKIMSFKEWKWLDDEDLSDYGDTMKQEIEQSIFLKKNILSRLEFFPVVDNKK